MNRKQFQWILILLPALLAAAPHLGFLHPSGAGAGTVIEAVAGGSQVHNVISGTVTGDGVTVEAVEVIPGFPRASGSQSKYLLQALTAAEKGMPLPERPADTADWRPHPWFDKIAQLTPMQRKILLEELRQVHDSLQTAPAIARRLILRIRVAADAKPGRRELRVYKAAEGSNPIPFFVSDLPEFTTPLPGTQIPVPPAYEVVFPGVVNGQLMPRGRCRFRFSACRGESFNFRLRARELNPFLGDCVPGHFQGVLEVRNTEGKLLVSADDRGPDPDPVLNFTAPYGGTFMLEVRDALYRGRADFTFRLEGRRGAASFQLPVPADTGLPVTDYKPPLRPGTLIRGIVAEAGAVRIYEAELAAGEPVTAEVIARRLGSPLDSRLEVRDPAGKVIAANDDMPALPAGLVHHQADSQVIFTPAAAGIYRIAVRDNSGNGSPEHQFYLRLAKPEPGFRLYAAPSSLTLPAGEACPIHFLAERRDGFTGEITLNDLPDYGFWSGDRSIPAGVNSGWCTLQALPVKGPQNFEVREITASGAGRTVTVIPADEAMQAFAYTHFVPAEEFRMKRQQRYSEAGKYKPVSPAAEITAGGETAVKIAIEMPKPPPRKKGKNAPASPPPPEPQAEYSAECWHAPEQLRAGKVSRLADGSLSIPLTADAGLPAGELKVILKLTVRRPRTDKEGKTRTQINSFFLPALKLTVKPPAGKRE